MMSSSLRSITSFAWPIPDRSLKKRIHRIAAPTLIIWGMADGIVARDYAQDFTQRIANAHVELIGDAGHLPYLEQSRKVAQIMTVFSCG
jgi:pimeloyl-ACP methyl ester carboxylesterase